MYTVQLTEDELQRIQFALIKTKANENTHPAVKSAAIDLLLNLVAQQEKQDNGNKKIHYVFRPNNSGNITPSLIGLTDIEARDKALELSLLFGEIKVCEPVNFVQLCHYSHGKLIN